MTRLKIYKKYPVLSTLLILELLLFLVVSYQIEVDAHLSLLEKMGLTLFAPVQSVLDRTQGSLANLSHEKKTRQELLDENQKLREQVDQLRQYRLSANELTRENERLRQILELQPEQGWRHVYARVVGRSKRNSDFTILVDKGSQQGIRPDLGVISAKGVVGLIWEVSPYHAKVMTISNPNTAVSAIIQASRYQDAFVTGIGLEDDRFVIEQAYLKNVPNFEMAKVGDVVLTSGHDHVFPKGLVIGTVKVSHQSKHIFQEIKIDLVTDFTRLEEVAILIPEARTPPAEEKLGPAASEGEGDRGP